MSEYMKKSILIILSSLLGCLYVLGQPQQHDALLELLKQELQYNMQQLAKQEQKPYFMNLRVKDVHTVYISSNFGAVSSSRENHQRTLVPQIRIGSPVLDNFKYQSQCISPDPRTGQTVEGVLLPLEDGFSDAVRQSIWIETLKRYKAACSNYEQAKTKASTSVADEDKAPCFSNTQIENYYESPLSKAQQTVDIKAWELRLNEISSVFKSCPELQNGSASLNFEIVRSYLVTSEGTEVVQNRLSARILLTASIKAADGMELPLHMDYFSYSPSELPTNDKIMSDAKGMINRLLALRDAPVADPYSGPAIMSGPASGVFFHEIFGHRLEGHRLKTGGQTFKKMIGKRVLPRDFQVYSDPTIRHYAGTDMNGYYLYDDEGVKARRVENVKNGVLTNFLMSRVPLDGFPESNGHGRASGGADPVSRQSNLIVETNNPFSETQLRKLLIVEAKNQGKEYGYYFKSVTSGFTYTGENGSLNSFNVTPLEVYRIFVDGRPDQLVRGVDMIGTPLSMFSNIQAAGDKSSVFTGSCGAESGWVPVTASSPMIYVSKIETQRREQSRSLPPILSAPKMVEQTVAKDSDSVIFAAMNDEMQRNKELSLPGADKPYYLSYTAGRARQFNISAVLGGVINSSVTPYELSGTTQLAVGDYQHNSDVQYGTNIQAKLPVQIDYNGIRRAYWTASDKMYRYSLEALVQKNAYLKQYPLPSDEAKLPDMQKLPAVSKILNKDYQYNIDRPTLEKMTSELSSIFKDYKDLYDTKVTVSGTDLDIYRLTTEGVKLKLPQAYTQLLVRANVRTDDGSTISDAFAILKHTPNEYPSLGELKEQVKNFADGLQRQKDLPLIKENYSGPVLYEGNEVAFAFINNLVATRKISAQRSIPSDADASDKLVGEKILDSKLSIKNYPDLSNYQGTPLIGNYSIDGDGVVPAKELTIVDHGMLKQLLNGRFPTMKAPQSTGSARYMTSLDQLAINTVPGTLHISAEKTIPIEKMEKELLKSAKKAGLKYAYIVRRLFGTVSTLLYRIDVKTGEKTQVRTANVGSPSLSNLTHIGAVSDKEEVMNYLLSNCCSSIIYPASMIVNNVEIRADEPKVEEVPALIYPLQR